jgi:hypothetical protein
MWDQQDCVGYLKTACVLAAYIDQSLSTNTFYNPAFFSGGKVPGTLIAKNLMLAYRWGLKTVYYSLINKIGAKVSITGTNAIQVNGHSTGIMTYDNVVLYEQDDDCEACKL